MSGVFYLTRGGQLPAEWWPMWLCCACPWWTWCPWWLWLCCEWVWWLSGLALCPWLKDDIILFWPGMLLACMRAMLDSTASQPSNPAWQHKPHVRAERGGPLEDSSQRQGVRWRWGSWVKEATEKCVGIMFETSTDPFHMVSNRAVGMVCHRRGLNACVFGGEQRGLHSRWGVTEETTPTKIIRGQSLKVEAWQHKANIFTCWNQIQFFKISHQIWIYEQKFGSSVNI